MCTVGLSEPRVLVPALGSAYSFAAIREAGSKGHSLGTVAVVLEQLRSPVRPARSSTSATPWHCSCSPFTRCISCLGPSPRGESPRTNSSAISAAVTAVRQPRHAERLRRPKRHSGVFMRQALVVRPHGAGAIKSRMVPAGGHRSTTAGAGGSRGARAMSGPEQPSRLLVNRVEVPGVTAAAPEPEPALGRVRVSIDIGASCRQEAVGDGVELVAGGTDIAEDQDVPPRSAGSVGDQQRLAQRPRAGSFCCRALPGRSRCGLRLDDRRGDSGIEWPVAVEVLYAAAAMIASM
jgi:hypothetical protein